jgi:2-oxoglutarate ferredoxin oxidoreductase subunit alpha
MDAFDLADKYRNPVMILGDGMTGQMMEPVEFGKPRPRRYNEKYILKGAGEGKSKFVRALILDALRMEEHNWKLVRKYRVIEQNEVRFETYKTGNARLVIIAYGIAARIAKGAINRLRDSGMKVGLIRPITLWPFPAQIIRDTAERIDRFLVFEMSTGQMIDDVKLALEGKGHVSFYGRPGGVVPTPAELAKAIVQEYRR